VTTGRRSSDPLRVLVAGTYEPTLARNRIILSLLHQCGHEVREIREDLWGAERYSLVDQEKLSLLLRAGRAYARLAWRLLWAPPADLALVLYPGYFDAPIVGLIGRLRRIPVVFDPFISLHDTLTSDRGLRGATSFVGRASRLADRVACRSAAAVLADTAQQAAYLADLTGVPRERFQVLPVGAQEQVFQPVRGAVTDPRLVLFYGTYIPLQGVETIVRAAKLLADEDVRFRLIGEGQERPRIERLVRELDARNVELVGTVPLDTLPGEMSRAALCLGIFGTTSKAGRVIPNKLYEALAVGRPVLTGATEAVRSAFDGAVATVPVGDPRALADAIVELLGDRARLEALASTGHARFLAFHSNTALKDILVETLDRVVDPSRDRAAKKP
jgi:glycosyltransferase involved in cell wall biosynthesis